MCWCVGVRVVSVNECVMCGGVLVGGVVGVGVHNWYALILLSHVHVLVWSVDNVSPYELERIRPEITCA